MNFDNLKYGFLISMTTMFGGSTLELYAQDENGGKAKIENTETYRQQFLESIAPDKRDISVEFVVDSVAQKTSNGDLVADVNVIQLLAYLDQDSDEYQSYMASRHIVAHEMWHRICMMNDVLEKPMSATHYRTGRDNFEITASLVQLLTFRDDYIHATPEQRLELRKLEDPKIRMYVMAAEHGLINPLSADKKDFDFEMEFIARTVSGYWNNNMAQTYAPLHNAMTEKSGRKEFKSPAYEKNFMRDIKLMNTIGGIDFSKLYNVKDVRNRAAFPEGTAEDTTVIRQSLTAPNYETWVNKRSQLKRFSRQKIDIPNFAGNRLAEERRQRPHDERKQPYQIAEMAGGYKAYPFMKVPFYAAVQLNGAGRTIKLYPHGAMDVIGASDAAGKANIKTLNYDGSYETGQLKNGRKDGVFVFYNRHKKEIGRCTYVQGRAADGETVLAAGGEYIRYIYKAGKLAGMDCIREDGTRKPICTLEGGKPVSGLIPTTDAKTSSVGRSYLLYSDKQLLAGLLFDRQHRLSEKQDIITGQYGQNVSAQAENAKHKALAGSTVRIERFYADGKVKYEAERRSITLRQPYGEAEKSNTVPGQPYGTAEKMRSDTAKKGTGLTERGSETKKTPAGPTARYGMAGGHPAAQSVQVCREALFAPDGHPVMAAEYNGGRRSLKIKMREFLSFLKGISMPGTDKNTLVSSLLAFRSRMTTGNSIQIAAANASRSAEGANHAAEAGISRVAAANTAQTAEINSYQITAETAAQAVEGDSDRTAKASADRTGTGSPLPATSGRKTPATTFENKTDITGKSSKNQSVADKNQDNPSARKISAFKNKARFMMMRQRENV